MKHLGLFMCFVTYFYSCHCHNRFVVMINHQMQFKEKKNMVIRFEGVNKCIKIATSLEQFYHLNDFPQIETCVSAHVGIIIENSEDLNELFDKMILISSASHKNNSPSLRKIKAVFISRCSFFEGLGMFAKRNETSETLDESKPIDQFGETLSNYIQTTFSLEEKLFIKCQLLLKRLNENSNINLRSEIIKKDTRKLVNKPMSHQGKNVVKKAHPATTKTTTTTIQFQQPNMIRSSYCSLMCLDTLPTKVIDFLGFETFASSHGELLSICGGSNSQQTIIESKVNIDASKLHEWTSHRNLPWAPLVLTTNECSKNSIQLSQTLYLALLKAVSSIGRSDSIKTESSIKNNVNFTLFNKTATQSLSESTTQGSVSTLFRTMKVLKLLLLVYSPYFKNAMSLMRRLMKYEQLYKASSNNINSSSSGNIKVDQSIRQTRVKHAVNSTVEEDIDLELSVTVLGTDIFDTLRLVFTELKRSTTINAIEHVFDRRLKLPSSSFITNLFATSQFCHSFRHSPSKSQPQQQSVPANTANTAVCFVGSTRTLLRQDVQDSLLYRFYAGWGIQHMWTFAVLSDTIHNRPPIEAFLDHLNTVALEWYEELSHPGRPCRESHEEMQLNQWAQCLGHIENYEKKENAKFDVVVKLRPDDLWYGAMLPHCVLNIRNTVYISRHRSRWSDQWFSLPRKLATPVLRLVQNDLNPHCNTGDSHSHIRKIGSPPFENMIFDEILKYSKTINNIIVIDVFLPRILARTMETKSAEIAEKCDRFLWFVSTDQCSKCVKGADIKKMQYGVVK